MNLYLSNGRVWTGTQADAKAAGPFVPVEVPTDKPSLIQWLNDRWAELLVPVPPPEPATLSEGLTVIGQKAVDAYQPEFTVNTNCPACNRTPRVAQIVVNCEASMTIQAALTDVTDPRSLDRIAQLIEERRAQL